MHFAGETSKGDGVGPRERFGTVASLNVHCRERCRKARRASLITGALVE